MKTVSIIIPVYNVGYYIEKTIESLLNQTCKEFEVILIDDGSIDDSFKLAKKILTNQLSIPVLFLTQENQGVSVARNKGLENSKGKYVLFLDADDYIGKDTVEKIKLYENNQYDFLIWKYFKIDNNKKKIYNGTSRKNETYEFNSIEILNEAMDGNIHLWSGNVAYKRSFLIEKKIRFTPNCINGEDLEFIYNAVIKSNKIRYINYISSFYVNREDSISNTFNIKKFDAILALNRVKKQMELTSMNGLIIEKFETKVILIQFLNLLIDSYKQTNINFSQILNNIDSKYTFMVKEIHEIAKKNIFKKQKLKTKIKMIVFILVFKINLWKEVK